MECFVVGFRQRKLSRVGKSLYDELGVCKQATEEVINKSYRRLALQYHPDKNPNCREACEKFLAVSRAQKILTDKDKRVIYDEYGSFGLYVAEHNGPEEVAFFSLMTNNWFQVAGFFTCCFCCCGFCCLCCCDGCCGLCFLHEEDSDEQLSGITDLEGSMLTNPQSSCDDISTGGSDVRVPPSPPVVAQPGKERGSSSRGRTSAEIFLISSLQLEESSRASSSLCHVD